MSPSGEKSAIVTGAAQRVGREIALDLAGQGYHIGLHYNSSKEAAAKTKSEIEALGVKCALLPCDLDNTNACSQVIEQAVRQLPGVCVLINNASIYAKRSFLETSVQEFEANYSVHLRAPYILTQSFARLCKQGNVINIADVMVARINIDYFAYCLTKTSLANFTQLAARALAPAIRVNAIASGSTMKPDIEPDPDYMLKRAENVPLKIPGSPKYIISGINFLLSNDYVTGDCLFIDGGVHVDVI